jgi:hypothetical protein
MRFSRSHFEIVRRHTHRSVRCKRRVAISWYRLAVPGKEVPASMIEPLDIFIKTNDGTYLWKAAADSFELAKSTVQRLAASSPGEYMIFNQTTGNKIVVKDGLPEPL